MAKEVTMSTWRKMGISEAGVDDLGDAAREILLGCRSPEAGTPLLLKPGSLDDLVAYLLELESPRHGDRGFARFRNALLASALELETKGGEKVVVLAEPAERLVRERISEFMAQDRSDLLALSSELGAAQTLADDGALLANASSTVASWTRAADAMESFLEAPRRAGRFDLEDFLLNGVDGIVALGLCVELQRLLLIAAGHALDTLGAATLGYHDFSGIDEAVAVWGMSQGSAARRLAKALAQLATRTQGLSGRVSDDALRPEPGDTSWIEPCSRLGQDVLRWVYGRGQGALNFASIVGVTWPGPALHGYDDEEAEPGMACELCAAFKGGRDANHPLVFGTYEATVSQDLVVPIPEDLLDEGTESLFVKQSAEETGALSCQTSPRHFARLAQLISSEQEFGGYPWDFIENGGSSAPGDVPEDFASDFEQEFALCASGEGIAVEGGGLPLREIGTCGWAKPGTPVVLLGLGDHFEIADAERHAAYEQQLGSDPSELPQTYFQD